MDKKDEREWCHPANGCYQTKAAYIQLIRNSQIFRYSQWWEEMLQEIVEKLHSKTISSDCVENFEGSSPNKGQPHQTRCVPNCEWPHLRNLLRLLFLAWHLGKILSVVKRLHCLTTGSDQEPPTEQHIARLWQTFKNGWYLMDWCRLDSTKC